MSSLCFSSFPIWVYILLIVDVLWSQSIGSSLLILIECFSLVNFRWYIPQCEQWVTGAACCGVINTPFNIEGSNYGVFFSFQSWISMFLFFVPFWFFFVTESGIWSLLASRFLTLCLCDESLRANLQLLCICL